MIKAVRRQLAATLGVLRGFSGNTRAVLVTEPIWSIPYQLVQTYASVYMLALGCTPVQVGLIGSAALACQLVFSLVGGWITDRLGRRRTTLIFDTISWSGAMLLWAFARSFPWFLAAAMVNSLVRIVMTSWTCLAIEDTAVDQRVHFFTWISVAGTVAGFVVPLSGALVGRFGLVPAMRGLYLFGFAVMTTMFFFRNRMVVETRMGIERMRESRTEHPRHELGEHLRAASVALRNPAFSVAAIASILAAIMSNVRNTFQSILLTRGLGFPEAAIAVFPLVNAAVTLVALVLLVPALARRGTAAALAVGFGSMAASAALLAASPERSWPIALLATALGGIGSAVVFPVTDGFLANAVPDQSRAKVMAVFYVVMFAASSPFSWVGGLLAAVSSRLPLALVAVVCLLGFGLSALVPRAEARAAAARRPDDRPAAPRS
jgi:DHA1 family tetracycline resistance protein-like MFS transporter